MIESSSMITGCYIVSGSSGTDQAGMITTTNANQTQINGCIIYGGDWGVTPPFDYVTTLNDNVALNVRLSGNILIFQTTGGVNMATGWHVVGNTFNWLSAGGYNLGIGSDAGTNKYCSGHSVITGNNFHAIAGNLDSHIEMAMDSALNCGLITITGNLFMGSPGSYSIDLGGGCVSGCSDAYSIIIDGNTFASGSSNDILGLNASASSYSGITIGSNAFPRDNASCTAENDPYECCTGSTTGTCHPGFIEEGDMFSNWDASWGTWTARPRRFCGRFANVDADTDHQMLTMEGSYDGGSYILRGRSICQGTCTTQADIQLQVLECATGADAGEYCDADADCVNTDCGVDLGSSFNSINPATEETQDWSIIQAETSAEDLIGFDVDNTPTAGDEYLVCFWYLP